MKSLFAIQYKKDYILTHAYPTKEDAEKDIKRIAQRPLWDNEKDYKVIKIDCNDINFIWLKDLLEKNK